MYRRACAVGAALISLALAAAAAPSTAAAPSLRFAKPLLVDPARAGGEPTVVALPNGELLYSGHAQLTHYHAGKGLDPVALAPFRGQAYVWRSADRGATWTEVAPPATAHGGSDPDFTLDAAGNVYFAEITPAQVSVARSVDGGRTWTAAPVAAAAFDREWLAGGAANEVYMSGKLGLDVRPATFRSVDGGLTWTLQSVEEKGAGMNNKLWYDPRSRSLHHPYVVTADGGYEIGVAVSTDQARTWTRRRAATIPRLMDHSSPPSAVDRAGLLHLAVPVIDANGHTRLGITTSKNAGVTWSKPVIVGERNGAIYPWLVAGDRGRVAAAWLCADRPVVDAETQPAAWSVCAAVVTGADTRKPSVYRARVTPKPVHDGPICLQGIICEAIAGDRRLGEFITVAADRDGSLLVAYSDTTTFPDSAVARPGFVRQSAGPRLYAH